MLGIDLSNYSTNFDIQGAQRLYAAGIRKGVVQLVNPSVNNHQGQFNALVRAGIEVEAYVYLWFEPGFDMSGRMVWACEQLKSWPQAKRIWLDCEDPSIQSGGSQFAAVNVISACVSIAKSYGLEVGIYTGAAWWRSATGDSDQFSDLPLWYAHYDGVQSFDDWDSIAFGGWSR